MSGFGVIGGILNKAAPMGAGGASGPLDALKKAAGPVGELLSAAAPLAGAAASMTPIGMGVTAAASLLGGAASPSPDKNKAVADNNADPVANSFTF